MKKTLSVILSIILIMTFAITSVGLISTAVQSIKLSTGSITLQVGKTYTLQVTITPADATNKKLTYLSGNKDIATVDKNGKIKGIKAGKTVITVTSSSNRKAVARCKVTISQVSKIELWTYWDSSARNKAWYDMINAFDTATSDVSVTITYFPTVELTKQISISAAGGTLPHTIQFGSAQTKSFTKMGILTDITDKFLKYFNPADYYPGPMQAVSMNGRIYAVPLVCNNLALYYNKDKFKEAGIAAPPKDWNEYKEFAKKLTKGDTYGLALALKKIEACTFQFLPYLWMSGSDIDTLDSPETIQALNLYVDLFKSKVISMEALNWNQQDAANQFIAGKAAMYVEGSWRLSQMIATAKFNWGVALLPKGPKDFATSLGGENLVVIKGTNEDAGWELAKWTQMPENMLKLNIGKTNITPRKDVVASSDFFQKDEYMKIFSDMMAYSKSQRAGVDWPNFSGAIENMVQEVVTGIKTPEQAAKDASEKVKQYLPLQKN